MKIIFHICQSIYQFFTSECESDRYIRENNELRLDIIQRKLDYDRNKREFLEKVKAL